MASQLSWQIKCSICLRDFTDPVMLPCQHSFCRECITGHMHGSKGQSFCPECRRPYTAKDLHSNRLLRNMTGAVRQHLTAQQVQTDTSSTEAPQALNDMLMCANHDEKLKLFCETDQKLLCVVCRDGDKHRGHHFKPVKEAARIIEGTLKGAVGFLNKENGRLNDMTQKQATEVTKTQMRSKQLSAQISAQFEEMHRFLKKKEEEIKKQLETQEQDAVTAMCKNTSIINNKLMDGKELECIFQSALDINQPDLFLQWWNEKGFPVTERMKIKHNLNPDVKYESWVKGLNVIPHSLFLGPYETHLQFFVWKAMLGAVKPVPEILRIMDPGDSYLKVSPGKSSVRQADRQSSYYKDYNPGVISEQKFQSGQHYWELDVGNKLDWSIGVKTEVEKTSKKQSIKSNDSNAVYLHLKNGKGYTLSSNGNELPIVVKRKPCKIGLYLDCDRKQISFYDADIMTQILITSYKSALPCSIILFPGVYLDGTNNDPVTVCSYESNSAHSP
ncbi:tripartite motif containing 108 [Pangasianodon hypophthalmus]|uniref:tripartite motif containing 108 n=1 Tax=Pangasianodon hypophthalmus TaxID=310915 RepID=UPI0023080DDF|nr:tripartite motif containing 108 [Pangasianodon hypophthalmus]